MEIVHQTSISREVTLGTGVYFPHGAAHIHGETTIGDGVVVGVHTGIGLRGSFFSNDMGTRGPTIGAYTRVGTGASYRLSDRLSFEAEVSDGDLGPGGRFGTSYLPTERTTLYMNYALENERTDNGLAATSGSEGNLVAGVKKVVVVMEHTSKDGSAKFKPTCDLPLTGANVVDMLITDLAVFARPDRKSQFKLIELAPGVSAEEIKAKTAAAYQT